METIQPLSSVKPIQHPRDGVFSSEWRAAPRKPFSLLFPKTSAAPVRGDRSCWLRIHVKLQAVSSSQSAKGVSTVDTSCDADVQRPWKTYDARLVLEDGSIWRAKSFGASGMQVGEVVFNTSLTGYQEILTDPSYAGQFVLMTNPHIGNTGVNPDDEESSQCFLAGLVIRNLSICTSNWRCTESLGDYLAKRNIMGIYDVDTRAITRRLRRDGSLIGVLSTEESQSDVELLEMARRWKIVAEGRRNKLQAIGMEATWSDGFGGEALYCLIVMWLAIISWIIFTGVDDPEDSQKRCRSRGKHAFIGATATSFSSGCDGGYGVCDTCAS